MGDAAAVVSEGLEIQGVRRQDVVVYHYGWGYHDHVQILGL